MSLARLWQRQGKHAETHELLAPVYGWFTEGFDTANLQEAKAVLGRVDELFDDDPCGHEMNQSQKGSVTKRLLSSHCSQC
jgi:hypothetical protein